MIALLVVLGIATAFMTSMFFDQKSKTAKASTEVLKNDSIANANWATALEQEKYKKEAQEEVAKLEAELDTIQPLALQADSLKSVAIELQKQLAACATASQKGTKASKAVTGTGTVTTGAVAETPAQLAKKLKGNPAIDDVAKTFTFVKSDKADSTLMAKAPAGYKLIEKPR